MAIVSAMPFDEYLRTSFRPDREYRNGQVVERKAGESFHARMQGLIFVRVGGALPHAVTPVL